jgi:hypothetical protein
MAIKKMQINHIDGNKLNNNIENLEYCDNSHNQLHAYRLGLNYSQRGEKHYKSKLSEKQVVKIMASTKGYSELAKMYKVSRSAISHIKKHRSWTWLFTNERLVVEIDE